MNPNNIKQTDNNFRLDTTGENFKIGRCKPTATKLEQNAEKQAEQKLFYDNAFVFFANRERIQGDMHMFLAPVPIQSGLAYTGMSGFRNPTLGVYLEFWLNCPSATIMDRKGRKGLVCRIAGSALTGGNKCNAVDENGNVKDVVLQHFRPVWHTFMDINKKYNEAKATGEYYSLQQVIDILTEEGLTEYDKNAMEAFFYKRSPEYRKTYRLRQDVRRTRMETKRKQLKELVDKVNLRQKEIDALSEEINGQRRIMLRKFHANEMTAIEYQRWWMALPLRKERHEEKAKLRLLVHDTLKALFPDYYTTMSIEEVREFVESHSGVKKTDNNKDDNKNANKQV